jgi:FkbM family methyltransferase
MMALQQFVNKIKTHGVVRTVGYSLFHVVRPYYRKFWLEPVKKSYSQSKEDLIIDRILGNKKDGIYLDIGAFDPYHTSNTKRFYDRGWHGVNIEPEPSRCDRIKQARTRDINLNVGLSRTNGRMTFFDVDPPALATFSPERAAEVEKLGAKVIRKIDVEVVRLDTVFEKYLQGKTVDFCTLDAEGLDLEILKSNDWTRFRPKVICVEVSNESRESEETTEKFLIANGYRKVAQTYEYGNPLNAIYVTNK